MRMKKTIAVLLLVGLSAAMPGLAHAGKEDTTMKKTQEDSRYRWNLADIYPDAEAWKTALDGVQSSMDRLDACKGSLGKNASSLKSCLDNYFSIMKQLRRVGSYASMLSDENTRDPKALEMRQTASMLGTRFSQRTSFFRPEILALGEPRILRFLADEPGLVEYRHFLEDILRGKPHTLSAQAESVLATAGLMADAPSSIYSILTNAEIPWPTITLSDGRQVRLDQAGYTRWRATANRADRKKVFDAFWETWHHYERTCGVTLYSQMKRDLFYAQARKYPSCLAAALDGDAIPEAVYRTLVQQTNANLETLHRYFRLRARMLGIKDLRYYDIYPPLVKAGIRFPIDRGEKLVLEAIQPLGSNYVATVEKGFEDRWMDAFPRPGKRSGAYSSGSVYDVHPYVLMNYNGDYESVSTMAHEWGHTMHSYLANAAQPYPTADYSIFVAEVASTFNEALLLDHMLTTASNDTERLYYLGSALEGLRGTFFRQAMFAEFELKIHELVEKGEALSGQRFSEIYGELLRRYNGDAQGIMKTNSAYTVEWAYIPHFYYDFYVYQYATSIAASSLFAQEVLAKKPGARDRFLSVLKAGGSRYPYELLKNAGVDLATPAPYEALVKRMNTIMDEIEAILDRQNGKR